LATNRSPRHHPVLAAVSRGCPGARGRFPRVTHPSATRCRAETLHPVRLACVRRAASVRSEPGSNSQLHPAPARHRASIQITPTPPLGPPTLPKLQPAPAGGSLRHRLGTFSQRSRRQDPKDIPASRTRLFQRCPNPQPTLRPPPAHPFLLHHNVKYHKADWRRLRPQPFRPRKAEPHYVVEVSDRRQRSRYLGLLTLPFKPFLRLPHDLHPSHRRPAGTGRNLQMVSIAATASLGKDSFGTAPGRSRIRRMRIARNRAKSVVTF
jgi:hypothetical protein